jgi:hypothetical protein
MAKVVKIKDNTAAVQKRIKGLSGDALVEFLQLAKDITHDTAPRRVKNGGNHANSIDIEFYGLRKKKAGILFSSSNYGAYLEFGTYKMVARPHFRPGIQTAINEFQQNGLWGE